MNTVLRQLGRPNISRGEIAALLEKHVGRDPSEHHCEEALAALHRLKDEELSALLRVLARLVKAGSTACGTVREAIELLRGQPEGEITLEGTSGVV